MTGTRDKLRSLFLTALMIGSVFAGTVALSGSVAAQSVNSSTFDETNGENADGVISDQYGAGPSTEELIEVTSESLDDNVAVVLSKNESYSGTGSSPGDVTSPPDQRFASRRGDGPVSVEFGGDRTADDPVRSC